MSIVESFKQPFDTNTDDFNPLFENYICLKKLKPLNKRRIEIIDFSTEGKGIQEYVDNNLVKYINQRMKIIVSFMKDKDIFRKHKSEVY